MRHRISLPRELGAHFSVSEAAAHGVGRGRRDAADLARPFHGIRSQVVPESFSVRVACYLPRLRPGQRLAARTALRLWGMPFPQRWQPDEPVDVTVLPTSTPPRARGTAGHRLAAGRAETWRVDGAPMIDPIAALFQCAPGLTILQAVILIDALVTEATTTPGSGPAAPAPRRRRSRRGWTPGVAFPDARRSAAPCRSCEQASSRRRRPRRDGSSCPPGFRSQSSSTRSGTAGSSSRASTSRIPSCASPSSTRATATGPARPSGAGTSAGSATSRTAAGSSSASLSTTSLRLRRSSPVSAARSHPADERSETHLPSGGKVRF